MYKVGDKVRFHKLPDNIMSVSGVGTVYKECQNFDGETCYFITVDGKKDWEYVIRLAELIEPFTFTVGQRVKIKNSPFTDIESIGKITKIEETWIYVAMGDPLSPYHKGVGGGFTAPNIEFLEDQDLFEGELEFYV